MPYGTLGTPFQQPSAGHLTPYRRPTLTPSIAIEVIATAKEISSWLGSWLDADRVKVRSRYTR
jgi:hypothetical protein